MELLLQIQRLLGCLIVGLFTLMIGKKYLTIRYLDIFTFIIIHSRYVKGCVQSCNDLDGCNYADKNRGSWTCTAAVIIIMEMMRHL